MYFHNFLRVEGLSIISKIGGLLYNFKKYFILTLTFGKFRKFLGTKCKFRETFGGKKKSDFSKVLLNYKYAKCRLVGFVVGSSGLNF